MARLNRIQRWQKQRRLRHSRLPLGVWEVAVGERLDRYGLSHAERRRLRELASLFLYHKTISGAGGLVIQPTVRVEIAALACLLILNLDLEYYRGWTEVIVYPGRFVVDRQESDATGVVHQTRRVLGGEAWLRGPVILSQTDVNGDDLAGNIVLHEFAHKLDMLTGSANGMPPLHPNMVRSKWTEAFSRAYAELRHQVEHRRAAIDPYAAQSPAEFFAVVTVAFFEQASHLKHTFPHVYQQLCLFYRQDPLQRLGRRDPAGHSMAAP